MKKLVEEILKKKNLDFNIVLELKDRPFNIRIGENHVNILNQGLDKECTKYTAEGLIEFLDNLG